MSIRSCAPKKLPQRHYVFGTFAAHVLAMLAEVSPTS